MREIGEELNNKGTSLNKLNTLNNEYEQKIKKIEKELNDKNISIDEYIKKLNELDITHKQEIKILKKE